MVGGFHGMLLLSAKHSRSLFWWEGTMWKEVRETIERTSDTVCSSGRISPYLCEGHIESTSIWSKSLARYVPRLCIVCGWNLERRHYDRRHWGIGEDGSEIHARRLNAKEVLTANNFIFPVADGTVKTPGGDQRLRPSTLIRDCPQRGEEQEVFRAESDGLPSSKPSSRWLNTRWCGS